METKHDFFRANVGAVIFNNAGKVLACKRSDIDSEAWQLPQGGIHVGELTLHAVYREIQEEVAIVQTDLVLLAEMAEWLAYELPEPYRNAKTGRGQTQKWFLFRFVGSEDDIHPDAQEFTAWRWMELQALYDRVVTFRRPIYQRLLQEWTAYLGSRAISEITIPH